MKNTIKIFLILIVFIQSCYLIYKNENKNKDNYYKNLKTNYIEKIIDNTKDDNIGRIIIKKINVDNKIYDINNQKNNVDKNVTILNGSIEPSNDNSIMFIAAHSGDGINSYFRDLDKLTINDEIVLEYKNIKYKYIVIDKWEEKKDGDIEVNKTKEKQLVLTTCSTKNKYNQLVLNCIEKESY